MTTAPKQDPATRTPWQRLTTEQKREAVRALVEGTGRTYTQAGEILGCSRVAVAGVVERASRTANPIVSSSGMQYGGNYRARARWPNGAKAAIAKPKAKAAPKPRKQPHAGFHKFVALPGIPDAVLEQAFVPARTDVWEALPGSTPVAIEHHTTGCRFPVGETSPFAFCNLPVKDGPYCPQHSALCYREPPSKKAVHA